MNPASSSRVTNIKFRKTKQIVPYLQVKYIFPNSEYINCEMETSEWNASGLFLATYVQK